MQRSRSRVLLLEEAFTSLLANVAKVSDQVQGLGQLGAAGLRAGITPRRTGPTILSSAQEDRCALIPSCAPCALAMPMACSMHIALGMVCCSGKPQLLMLVRVG